MTVSEPTCSSSDASTAAMAGCSVTSRGGACDCHAPPLVVVSADWELRCSSAGCADPPGTDDAFGAMRKVVLLW